MRPGRARPAARPGAVTTPEALAREKFTRIFGPAQAETILARLLGEMGIAALTTMEELDRFARGSRPAEASRPRWARPSRSRC